MRRRAVARCVGGRARLRLRGATVRALMPKATPETDRYFFAALRRGATVLTAAAAASYSSNYVYTRRRDEPAFRAKWETAVAACNRRAYERHTAGLDDPDRPANRPRGKGVPRRRRR